MLFFGNNLTEELTLCYHIYIIIKTRCKELILQGNIVISVGLFGYTGGSEVWENMDDVTLTKTKEILDDMHKRKN